MKCLDCADHGTDCPGCGSACDNWSKDAGHTPCKACLESKRTCRFAPVKPIKSLGKAIGSRRAEA